MTADDTQQGAEQAPPAPPLETRQFGFWLGDWTATWGDGATGSNSIRAIMNGHVILENFDGRPGEPLQGMSVSTYNPRLRKWQQTWVDNYGSYLDLSGEFADGKMTLAMERAGDAKPIMLRMVFYNITTEQFDWNWERSEDAGQSWELLWRIHYRRKQAAQGGAVV